MNTVVRVHNWGAWDELDGKPLVEGERLVVQWPDGSTTAEVCHVAMGALHYSDHGHPGTGPDDLAYVAATVRGLKVRVPLAGMMCQRGEFTNATTADATVCAGRPS